MGEKNNIEQKTGSKKGQIFTFIIGAVILAVVIFRVTTLLQPPQQEEELKVSVKTVIAERMNIEATAPISGKIQPVEEVTVMSAASGEVIALHAEVGDSVRAGQVLFQVDGTQMSTMLNQSKEAMEMAKSVFDRISILYEEGACSKQEYEQAKTAYKNAQESHRAAGDAYSNTIVKSPISGYITANNVSLGGMIGPGTPAMVVADVSSLIINTGVSDYVVSRIKNGDRVELFVKNLGEETFTGTIVSISPAPALGAMTYPIKISVDSHEDRLKAGMLAEIRIISERKENSVCVPSEAVIIKDGKQVVFSVDKNGITKSHEVETGIDNGTHVEIISGIVENTEVIVEGQQYVSEGREVNIVDKN